MAYVKEIPCAQVLRLTGRVCITATALPPVVPALSGAKAAEKGSVRRGPGRPHPWQRRGAVKSAPAFGMQACSAAIYRERASPASFGLVCRGRFPFPTIPLQPASPTPDPRRPLQASGVPSPFIKWAICPRRAPFRRLACIWPPWAPVYHSPRERGINGAKKKGFSHAKKLSEKPSRRNRIKKEQPPCSGRPFPVTRTKRTTKGMRSDRTAGMLSHGC